MPLRTIVVVLCAGLTALAPTAARPARAQASRTTVAVDASADRRPISPLIYGVAFATAEQLADLRAPLNRRGGNTTTTYNWRDDVDNRAADYFFESLPIYGGQPGGDADDFVAATRAGGADVAMTIPTIGWVAKLGPNRSRLASFSVAKYGPQRRTDQYFPDAGNGVRPDGSFVTGNDPTDAYVSADSAFQRAWVDHLVSKWGGAASGGVRYYCLDNEPSIWFSTHRDVRPTGAKMEEIRDAWIDYAAEIRAADPAAVILGPEEWGYLGYLWSGFDQQYAAAHDYQMPFPDRAAHGDMDYIPWLLGELRQHDQATGARSIDVLSVHYYPQGPEFSDDVSPSTQAVRDRSTRSLWDSSYVDQSYINDVVRLVPRLREWSDTYYPGLKIGVTEYNWGAEGHINGATAQADIFGIFGREGLDVATRWTTPDTDTPTYKAMKLYRNYDGAGGAFGDTSVRASMPNPDAVSAFAAIRASDGALTVMVVAKSAGAAPVRLALASFEAAGPAQVWQLTSANRISRLADAPVDGGEIEADLPKQSVTLFVIPSAAPGAPHVAVTSPNGGEKARAGAALDVAWTADGDVASQRVLLSSDGGATYPVVLADDLDGAARSFSWQVPATIAKGKHYRVRVEAASPSGATGADASDRDFRIKKAR